MLGRLLGGQQPEARAITYQSLWAAGDVPAVSTLSGTHISQESAVKINAVYAAVRLYSDTVSMLPRDTYIRSDGERRPFRPKPAWVENPDPDGLTAQQFYAQWITSKLLSHAACVRILRDRGEVVALKVLNPLRVERIRLGSGDIAYRVDGTTIVAAEDMIYDTEMLMPGALMGSSRVDELRETLGLSKALDAWAARYFGQGTVASVIIEYPGDMSPEQAKTVKDSFEQNSRGWRNAHRPNILTGGAKINKLADDAEKAQLTAAREFALEEVARAFRIPPAMLQSQKPGSIAYSSREQDAIQFVTYSLLPYVAAIENHLSRLLPSTAFLRFNVDSLLRASLTDRYAAYSQGIQAGFLSINDIHRLEDMRPVSGGDTYRVPLANVDLAAANIAQDQIKVDMATKLINVGFEPEAVLTALDLPRVDHTGLPSVQLQAVDASGDTSNDNDADEAPQRTVRTIERDDHGNVVRIIDQPA